MKPYYSDDLVTLYHGSNLDVLPGLDPVDAVVTDPPYGLKFMGKDWDHGVPGVPFWSAIRSAMKPGAMLLSFGGTRTSHRMVCAIEDSGLEIRDCVMWVYGSGFPKSLDIGKAVEKVDAVEARRARQLRFTEWMRGTGLTQSRIDELTGTNMGGHYLTSASQPAVTTRELFEILRPHFGCEIPAWVDQMVDERTVESENFKRREVVGKRTTGIGTGGGSIPIMGDSDNRDVTAPATAAAKLWDGWGTALKPAYEPISVAMNPLDGTFAENAIRHGVAGINVNGCRIETSADLNGGAYSKGRKPRAMAPGGTDRNAQPGEFTQPQGRWPANIIHDGSDEVVGLFPETKPGWLSGADHRGLGYQGAPTDADGSKPSLKLDGGSAARFFYCAKASGGDRGNNTKPAMPLFGVDEEEFRNTHPTVKPLELMRYLLRLVATPTGGVVLDPFAGSGSTLVAAKQLGRRAIGVEKVEEHCEIAANRLSQRAT